MNCRKCGNVIGAGLKFCTNCGTPVEISASAPTAPKEPPPTTTEPAVTTSTQSCLRCGASLKPGLHFCTACGARAEVAYGTEAGPDDKTAEVEVFAPPPANSAPESLPDSSVRATLPAKSVQESTPSKSVQETPAAERAPEGPPAESAQAAPPAMKPVQSDPAKSAAVAKSADLKQVNNGPRCAECGAAVMPTARVCFKCGARLGQSKPAVAAPAGRGAAHAAKSHKADGPDKAPPLAAAATPVDPAKPAAAEKTMAEPKPAAATTTASSAGLADAVPANKPSEPIKKVETAEAEQGTVGAVAKPAEKPAPAEARTDTNPPEGAPPREDTDSALPAPTRPVGVSPGDAAGVCTRCGAGLSRGLKFCTRCGATVPAETAEVATPAEGGSAQPPPAQDIAGLYGKTPMPAWSGEIIEIKDEGFKPAQPEPAADGLQTPPATTDSSTGECPACGAQLDRGVQFCLRCGAAVASQSGKVAAPTDAAKVNEPAAADTAAQFESRSDEIATTQEPSTETEIAPATAVGLTTEEPKPTPAGSAAVVCAKCGAPANAGVRFCISCGEPVEWWRTGGTAGSHANRPPSASAPAPVKRKGIPAGVLVAIFLLLLLVLAGCAFWLWRSMQYSAPPDVAITRIPEDPDGAAGPANNDANGSTLTSEDVGKPADRTADASEATPVRNDAAAEPAGTAGSVSGARAVPAADSSPSAPTSGGSRPVPPRKSALSISGSTTKAVQTAQNANPAPQSPVPFVDDPPPSGARQAAAAPSRAAANSPPSTAPTTQPTPTPARPAEPAAPLEGVIFWSGRLQRNKRFIISTKGTDYGYADGSMLPGTPVEVRVLSPAVRVVEAPGPNNSWQRVILECTRNTNQSVTINVQWFAAR